MLTTLGTVSAAGLAGCNILGGNGNGGSGNGDLGERVATLNTLYFAGLGGLSDIHESFAPVVQDSIEELGVTMEHNPVDVSTAVTNAYNDRRETSIQQWFYVASPERLDPSYNLRRMAADWAGANEQGNPANYANCDYTEAVFAESDASSEEERRELVSEVLGIMSEDSPLVPMTASLEFQAARTDLVDIGGAGAAGLQPQNIEYFYESEPLEGDTVLIGTGSAGMETNNHMSMVSSTSMNRWSHGVYSPLCRYDDEWELHNVLADSITIEDDAQRWVVELVDAPFHNGDPVTAEDVQFTFELIWGNAADYPQATNVEYDSVDVIDDQTVEFSFPEPDISVNTNYFPKWGILPRDHLVDMGIEDSPAMNIETVVGSGPFQLEEFDAGNVLSLVPAENDHPVWNPDHNVTLQVYQGSEPMRQAFSQGAIHVMDSVAPSFVDRIQNEMSDVAEVFTTEGFLPFCLNLQWPMAPIKFDAFRDAVGKVIDRQEANDLALLGEGQIDTSGSVLSPAHPFRPPDDDLYHFTDDPSGDVDAARSVLEEAGFGWDDDGNLHYPTDADISPRWPDGSAPSEFPDEYPCLSDL